jgi:hypothetical protein
LTCISCFYIYLVKYFHLNEKFILLMDSSDRIGILYQNSDRIRIRQSRIESGWILNISQLSNPMHTSRAYMYCTLAIFQQFMKQTFCRYLLSCRHTDDVISSRESHAHEKANLNLYFTCTGPFVLFCAWQTLARTSWKLVQLGTNC